MEKVIFWDFDGTLVKKNTSFLDSLTEAMRQEGVHGDIRACREFLEDACSWNHPEQLYPHAVGELWWEELLGKTERFLKSLQIPQEKGRKIAERFRELAVSFPYEPFADGEEILQYAKERGYENYLLSNNFPELRETVRKLGLMPCFKDIFLSGELGCEKPNGEIFRQALLRAGNPQSAIMVGDNPKADIEGAKKAGLTAIQVHGTVLSPLADHVCGTLSELKEIL